MKYMKWPFGKMKEGESIVIWDIAPAAAQIAAHNCARRKGWKFQTKSIVDAEGRQGLRITRLWPDGSKFGGGVVPPVENGSAGRYGAHYPFDKLRVGESCTLLADVHGAEYVAKAISAAHHRKRKGIVFQTRTERGEVFHNGMKVFGYKTATFRRMA
jgi:hypothetical protein